MGFSRQEYWSGQPFPPPGDLPHPGIEPSSPLLQADSLPSEPPGKSPELCIYLCMEMWIYSVCTQSCLTLCNPMDYSPPGSSIHRFSRQGYWSGLPFLSPIYSVCVHVYTVCVYIYTHMHMVCVCAYIYTHSVCVCVTIYSACAYMCVCVIHSVCMSTESDPVHTNRGDMYSGTVD